MAIKGFWGAGAVDTPPDLTTLQSEGYPTAGDPAKGIPPTKPRAPWFFMIDQMRSSVIDAAGFTPKASATQFLEALQSLNWIPIKSITADKIADGVFTSSIPDAGLAFQKVSPVVATGSIEGRTLADRFADVVNVKDFGAVGDGVTDDTAAVQSMAESTGRLVFPSGTFLCSTIKVVVPVTFQPGSELSVKSGEVITISSVVYAPKQKIFGGDGRFVFAHDNTQNVGENSRQVHAAWFGVFPSPLPVPDQGPTIQKICDSLGNDRESEILFDIGNYYIDSSVAVPRACAIVGKGQRRTVFKTRKDGFPLFTTSNIACRFKGVQFEIVPSAFSATQNMRVSPFVTISHDMCDLQDIAVGHSSENIVIEGARCKVDGVIASFSGRLGAGSSVVKVSADDAYVRNVFCGTSSSAGVESVVSVCTATNHISSILIDNISSIMPSKCVSIHASSRSIGNVRITNVRHNGFTDVKPAAIVDVVATGTGSIKSVSIDGVLTSGHSENVILLEQRDEGSLSSILVDNVSTTGNTAASGLKVSGAVSDVVVSDTVNLRRCSVPFEIDRSASQIYISPVAEGYHHAFTKSFVVETDRVYRLDLGRSVAGGLASLATNSDDFALFVVRATKTYSHGTSISSSSLIDYATTSLSGTDGSAGKITIGFEDRTVYIENRSGSTKTFFFSLL